MPIRKIAIAAVLLVTAAVFRPFFSVLVMGSIFAAVLWPLIEKWEKRFHRRALGSLLITLGFGLGILLPAAGTIFSTVRAAQSLLGPPTHRLHESSARETPITTSASAPQVQGEDAENQSAEAPTLDTIPPEEAVVALGLTEGFFNQKLRGAWDWLSGVLPVDPAAFQDMAAQATSAFAGKTAELLTSILSRIPLFLLSLALTLLVVFFLLLDGNRVLSLVRANPWFTATETERLLSRAGGTARFGILASLASGLGQTVLFTLAAWIAGLPNVVLLGTLVFIGSFVPVVGSAPVTVGTSVYLFMNVGVGSGIAFAVVAALVGVVDNFVRPAILRGSANLHPLLAMLSALGGLSLFGFCGVFLGPILVVLATEVLNFARADARP